ncbi:Homeodomain-like [Phytophthora cactorum]|nr:Homeodomain-like [Phytophthora cactorum]
MEAATAAAAGVGIDVPTTLSAAEQKKRELIALAQIAGVREVCRMEGIPRRTLRHWLDDADKINSFEERTSSTREALSEVRGATRLHTGRISHRISAVQYDNDHDELQYNCATSRAPATQSTEPVPPSRELQTAAMPSNSLECEPDDDTPLLFGLDIGTTAIKCVLVKADGGQTVAMANVSLSDVAVPTRPGEDVVESRIGVQNVGQVLLAVQRAVKLLPETARRRVTSPCRARGSRTLDGNRRHKDDDTYEPVWSELITWQDQRCSPAFLESCREKIARYGLASFAHTLENSPRTLVGMDACGTIHDFVAFVLCGHTLPSETFMDTTDAHSWGGLNLQTQTWDPKFASAGYAGFGLPANKPVCVPMGDHPCSVLAALSQRQSQPGSESNLTLVNIGTSAQMAMVLTGSDVAKLSSSAENTSQDQDNSSFEVRPFLFEDRFLGVAASLSGGNTFAWLVQQWQQWIEEMGLTQANNDGDEEQAAQLEGEIYARLIGLGLQREDTELTFVPTLNGERADPDATGSITNLRMNNWSMGDISAALCRGLVDNLFAMIPTELQPLVSMQPMIGTGNALVRNELLQRFLQRRLAQPQGLHLQTAADAAVGAALTPSLLDGRPVVLNV